MIIIPKHALVVLIGPSGAGKSTLAHKHFPAEEIISSDDLREELLGDRHSLEKWWLIYKVFHERITKRLNDGLRAVGDMTHLTAKDRALTRDCAVYSGAPIFYLVFNRSLAEKKKTGGWRLTAMGGQLIDKHDRRFGSSEAMILKGDMVRENLTVIDARVDEFKVEM